MRKRVGLRERMTGVPDAEEYFNENYIGPQDESEEYSENTESSGPGLSAE